ncbi:CsgB family curlin monomer nucleation component [Trabulsiella guamensis ATCC 49490]|uniref:CsgB family curlin monomer nucleation component n=1 Tax=Trabulsiella guamensis ATCC 49490 TaxID=1005994 RepID=A0A085AGQ7_9ENTR|nr:curli minor subunit CsgB [Trabulsiella guamensis]KFC09402.1 CsgB family curlin monomer nucleation component [Trabulsiella guamensis ATCC 49490]
MKNKLLFMLLTVLGSHGLVIAAGHDLANSEYNLAINELSDPSYNQAAIIGQQGSYHNATIRQSGSKVLSVISQEGSANRARIDQSGTYNLAYIAQAGSTNDANIQQGGYGNTAAIIQKGSGNKANISQFGTQKTAVVVQRQSQMAIRIIQR